MNHLFGKVCHWNKILIVGIFSCSTSLFVIFDFLQLTNSNESPQIYARILLVQVQGEKVSGEILPEGIGSSVHHCCWSQSFPILPILPHFAHLHPVLPSTAPLPSSDSSRKPPVFLAMLRQCATLCVAKVCFKPLPTNGTSVQCSQVGPSHRIMDIFMGNCHSQSAGYS